VSRDGLVWDFKLHQGVKFHDGSELTAGDVVYSFQRLLAIGKAPAAPFLPVLKAGSVSSVDRYSVRFQLEGTYCPFFATLAMVPIVTRAS
jgi:peptide/nickel transport system substrate-binding protein